MDQLISNKARLYTERYGVTIGKPLGSGNHGSVFEVRRNANQARAAVKFCKDDGPYFRELWAHETLRERQIVSIDSFSVPQLLGSDDGLLALEMSIVEPPFLLDFGGAYREEELPEFPENVWTEWREQKLEEFGERWPIVEGLLATLQSYGICMIDVHPRNITFREDGL